MIKKIRLDVGDIIEPLIPSGIVASWKSPRDTFLTYLVLSSNGWRAVTDQTFDPSRSNMMSIPCFIKPKPGVDSIIPDNINCRIEIRSAGSSYANGLFFYDDDDEQEYIIRTWMIR